MWDLDTSNTRAGNSKQVETILNDALKGLSVFDSNHVSDQRIVHFSSIAELVADGIKKKPKNVSKIFTHLGKSTHLRLCFLSHVLVKRLMDGSRPSGVMEMTLELLQYISIQIVTPAKEHSVFRGDSHKCRLFCWRCYHPIGDLGDLAKVLSSAPIKILLHHRLFPLNEDLEGDNLKNKGDNFFEDLFHVTPPLFSGSGELKKAIERDEESKAEEIYTCLYGEDYLPRI